jgi:hypothetical protein
MGVKTDFTPTPPTRFLAEYNNTEVCIDLISFMIKPEVAPVRRNDNAPLRWRLNG